MKAVDDNASKKKDEPSLYTSWTLSFTAPTSEEAQTVLSVYIDYISTLVVKESLENVRNKLEIKTQFEKEKLAEIQSVSYVYSITSMPSLTANGCSGSMRS